MILQLQVIKLWCGHKVVITYDLAFIPFLILFISSRVCVSCTSRATEGCNRYHAFTCECNQCMSTYRPSSISSEMKMFLATLGHQF